MTEALRDGNFVPTLLAVSNANGTTTLPVYANAIDKSLKVDDGIGGSDLSGDEAARDQNRVPVWMAVSATDGVTPVPIYADSTGNSLLVRTT